MEDYSKIEQILRIVKSKIDAHKEFRKAYDKQLAFDFSLFIFFKVGENKVSEILAYFLDEHQSHGQGDIFLKEFVRQFWPKKDGEEEIDVSNASVICEKGITNKRRIDVFIQLKDRIIAIENKIWAADQPNQLKDYADYLEKQTGGNFLLLYLTPYGAAATEKSIDSKFREELAGKEQYKRISYKHDIFTLIDKWAAICEADNVLHFIKEFKKFLKIKFLGNNTLNMSKNLKEIIYENQEEVGSLVKEYKAIEDEIVKKLNDVGKALELKTPQVAADLQISKSGLFNWYETRVYKYSISKGVNKIWVEYYKKEVHLYSHYYLQEGTEPEFKQVVDDSELRRHAVIDYNLSKNKLVDLFLERVQIACEIFAEYDKVKANEQGNKEQ